MQRTSVLIVGGSLVGLSASLFLATRGVAHVLLEKRPGSSPHPRAMGFTERTLEHYRAAGIGGRIPQVSAQARLRRVRAESLAGHWGEELPWTPGAQETPPGLFSPCTGAAIAQDTLEPILRQAAGERGAELRYRHELLDWHEVEDGVVAQVVDRAAGTRYRVHACYLIACDGADSPIRERLGIARDGVGYLRTLRSVLFRCEAADACLARGVQQFQIEQPGLHAFLTSYGDSRWVLMFDDDRERSDEELARAVACALGADLPFELITTGRWEMAGRIARDYRKGRVFLAGDAAHQLPPTRGGFGANTGIDDVHNLAWKLQLVLQGTATPALLDSYSAERQPIGWLRHQQTFARPDYARWLRTPLQEVTLYGNAAMELGQLQRSSVIPAAGPELPPADEPDAWAGQPGTRAPHAWVRHGGKEVSTLDLFGDGFVLLSGQPQWLVAGREVAARLGLPLATVQVGPDVTFAPPEEIRVRFGVGEQGAVLVRPDGVVAWRWPDAAGEAPGPAVQLADALRTAACLAG